MNEMLSVYKKLRPSSWRDEGIEGTERLKMRMEDAPYVVNTLDGSVLSLSHSRAMQYREEGDDILVTHISDVSRTSVIEQLKLDGLSSTNTSLSLTNIRKDEYHVTLAEAIRFFNTYQKVGVDINKVSDSGNSRGFYYVDILKIIARGCGLVITREKPAKGDYVEAIQLFHTTYEKEIAADKERIRLQTTLREELESGSDIPGI